MACLMDGARSVTRARQLDWATLAPGSPPSQAPSTGPTLERVLPTKIFWIGISERTEQRLTGPVGRSRDLPDGRRSVRDPRAVA